MAFVDGKEFKPLKRLLAAYFGDRPDLPLLAELGLIFDADGVVS